jgi:hypothetical protein
VLPSVPLWRVATDDLRNFHNGRSGIKHPRKLRKSTAKLGAWTWFLFTAHSIAFFGGVVLLAASLWLLHRDHLYRTAQPPGATAQQTGTNFVITGKNSVDEATHKQQMADCRDKIAKSRAGINSRTIKPGETLLFDFYDVASLAPSGPPDL